MFSEICIFGLHISTYYSMMFLGLIAMIVLMVKRRELYKISELRAVAFSLILMVVGVLGCKALYWLENWQDVQEGPNVGGFSFFGAVFLVPILMPLFGLIFGLSPGQAIDACAPCVAAMLTLIRVGCFLSGCCGGWAVQIGSLQFRWPTQAMESIGSLCILFSLLCMEERKICKGKRYAVYTLEYGILRFFVEFLRDTPKDWIALSHGQWFSIVGCLFSAAVLLHGENTWKNRSWI